MMAVVYIDSQVWIIQANFEVMIAGHVHDLRWSQRDILESVRFVIIRLAHKYAAITIQIYDMAEGRQWVMTSKTNTDISITPAGMDFDEFGIELKLELREPSLSDRRPWMQERP
jgi:hypothetical protein